MNSKKISAIKQIAQECIHCHICMRHCAFLRENRTPGNIAKSWLKNINSKLSYDSAKRPFFCNLCGLCTAVCPKKLPMSEMFLEMRRDAVRQKKNSIRPYIPILFYEQLGRSSLFRRYPQKKSKTIFFPGCNLPALLPKHCLSLLSALRKRYPGTELVLDCCSKPSHDLGRENKFNIQFSRTLNSLKKIGTKRLITACPNCYKVFYRYAPDMEVLLAWNEIEIETVNTKNKFCLETRNISVHDPCPLRFEEDLHKDIRKIINKIGNNVELHYNRTTTLCCGEGGSVCLSIPKYAHHWRELRQQDCNNSLTKGTTLITYCGGCVMSLQKLKPSPQHILTLLYPEISLPKQRGSLWNYLRRLHLKFSRKYIS